MGIPFLSKVRFRSTCPIAKEEGKSVTALAARRTLFEKLTKIKLPAPRIDPCIRIGELSSSIFYF
jgi:hypothetical protein